ncbi:phage terminase large subunit [Sulfitobacter sp. HNIBRBA3233]|uniref:phage terminase large subunit n=1 Tax=Sulfitobacter marinivivus TaxID=3158558 RepID=UPI0032DFD21F
MKQIDPVEARMITDALYRTSFYAFVWRCFDELHPGATSQFVPTWHVEAMCHELDKVRAGENKRLIINVPPRHLKSITVAVAFAAFVLGHHPNSKIVVASYGLDLAKKHSGDCLRIMNAAWYHRLFPGTRLAQRGNTMDELKTSSGGGRKSVSIGGAVTGHGADYIIIDDLMKAGDATSEVELERAQNYIDGSLLSRFDNPSEGRVVMIAQRLHEMDPPGYLLGKGGYRHLELPAIAEKSEVVALGQGRVHRRNVSEALFPQRMGLEDLERTRREMGAATFNCQYQQNPIAPDGSPLRWEWFGTYEAVAQRDGYQMIIQSWDTGMSADPRSDYSVCTTWGVKGNRWHLLDVYRGRLDFPDLKHKAIALGDLWKADRVLIEDAATGRPLLQECRQTDQSRFILVRPEKNKEIRFNSACAPVQAGNVLLPREAPWLPEFKRELQGFPRSRHDDQVDSFSQFLNWSKGNGFWRTLPHDDPMRVRCRREQINKPRMRS